MSNFTPSAALVKSKLPFKARMIGLAQQPDPVRRIGVLMGIDESDPAQQSFLSAFIQELRDRGWHEGRNVRIDYRWGAGDTNRIRSFARELIVNLKTATSLGLTVPLALLASADEVIE